MNKKYNATVEYNIFYDMGASSTEATLVAFSTGKDAKKKVVTKFEVKGVGYDRQLGGNDFDYRLAKHIGEQFKKTHKGPSNIFHNDRSWTKLMKEATRVKQILSANAETYARVESILDDKDLNIRVTRADFEELVPDLFARVTKPITDAVAQAGITLV